MNSGPAGRGSDGGRLDVEQGCDDDLLAVEIDALRIRQAARDFFPQPGPAHKAAGLARWAGLWEKTARRFAGAEGVNLDRKQVVITTLLDVQAAAA